MKHIIAVGASYVDTILTADHYPSEDEKLRASSISRRRGGNCPNTLEVLEQFIDPSADDIQLHLLAVLPSKQSDATKFIRNSFMKVKFEPSGIYRNDHNEAASSYIIKSESTDTRTIVNYNELPEMTAKEFIHKAHLMSVSEEAKEGWYHFEGRIPQTTLQCIRYLRSYLRGFKISVEVEKPGREGLMEIAAEADVVFYSKSWANAQGFQTAKDCLKKQAALTQKDALLCCTWGSEGATILQKSSDGSEGWEDVEAWKLKTPGAKVLDTIGAGDTFIAGMLFALMRHSEDWTLQQKLKFANELAGRKVIQEGFGGLSKKMEAHK
ncbi:putative ketohexokinase [Zopfia rhizophila CBS 207.26]|uniref:Putative ketohexokinase n=1 Tax=Zopfia rhizophila CBS 207.26 TaxID=1314779 RepID=A0A6A6D9N1_9PEZI|nr:putative ketohexokinase [Zopfia rhizophila CBS 207.26]